MTQQARIVVNTSCTFHTGTKYSIVKDVSRKLFGWRTSDSQTAAWDVFWTDTSINPDRLSQMSHHQKINHFPGMYAIARKNTMALALNKLRKLYPAEYSFYPRTWILPADLTEFRQQLKTGKGAYIVKPEASSQGRGIYLVRRPEDIDAIEHSVAQEYISSPFLIEGFKFDLRLYVLVTGCEPFRVFLHEQGLVRLATEPYRPPSKKNIGQTCMHLTNYAVNKGNPKFVSNSKVEVYAGHKRSLSSFLLHLEGEGYDVRGLWDQLCDLVVKTLLVVQPSLCHIYNSCKPNDISNDACFEILGFDVILTSDLKPLLLEVNHSPSFTTDCPLDYQIKSKVIAEAFRLMDVGLGQKAKSEKLYKEIALMRTTGARSFKETRAFLAEKKKKHSAKRNKFEETLDVGYIKIYPSNEGHYEPFLAASKEIWENFTARAGPGKSRSVNRRNEREASPESAGGMKRTPSGLSHDKRKSPYEVARGRPPASKNIGWV